MTIALIAILGLIPLLVCRAVTKSSAALITTGVLTCMAVSVTGNPVYTGIDVLVVLMGLKLILPRKRKSEIGRDSVGKEINSNEQWAALSSLKTNLAPAKWVDIRDPSKSKTSTGSSVLRGVITGLIACFVLWIVLLLGSKPAPGTIPDIARLQSAAPQVPMPASSIASADIATNRPIQPIRSQPRSEKKPSKLARECYQLINDEQMVRCVEKVK